MNLKFPYKKIDAHYFLTELRGTIKYDETDIRLGQPPAEKGRILKFHCIRCAKIVKFCQLLPYK